MKVLKHCNTAVQAMNLKVPTLSGLRKQIGEVAVEAYLKLWLLDLNKVLDLKHPMKPTQIDTIAMGVLQKYPSLNIAEINLVFKRAKFGEYSGAYDRVSVPTVMKWFREYFDERTNAAAQASQQQHLQHKSGFKSERSSVKSKRQLLKGLSADISMEQSRVSLEKVKQKINSKK